MIYEKDRLIRILSFGQFGGEVTTDEYYVRVRYDGFTICLRPEKNQVDFWVQLPNRAYLETSVPHPDHRNAHVSKAIRWTFGKLLDELRAERLKFLDGVETSPVMKVLVNRRAVIKGLLKWHLGEVPEDLSEDEACEGVYIIVTDDAELVKDQYFQITVQQMADEICKQS